MILFAIVAALLFAVVAEPGRASEACPPVSVAPGQPYFDFQVTEPAVYNGSDSARVRPDVNGGRRPYPPDFALAQFVVDSLGVPRPSSLKLLIQPAELSTAAVAEAITQWTYKPARLDGCAVPQLVQTPLRWK